MDENILLWTCACISRKIHHLCYKCQNAKLSCQVIGLPPSFLLVDRYGNEFITKTSTSEHFNNSIFVIPSVLAMCRVKLWCLATIIILHKISKQRVVKMSCAQTECSWTSLAIALFSFADYGQLKSKLVEAYYTKSVNRVLLFIINLVN